VPASTAGEKARGLDPRLRGATSSAVSTLGVLTKAVVSELRLGRVHSGTTNYVLRRDRGPFTGAWYRRPRIQGEAPVW
jgi:hypothetical protein